MQPILKRQVFTTSREMEFFSESELVTQTGYDRTSWYPGVFVKELSDNGLDGCEQAGVAPEISICQKRGQLTVSDNGPGLPLDVITRIIDFSTRTSDKANYTSPTRGAQGNALKTVLAMPYVLNEGRPTTVLITACGLRHRISVSTDHILRKPQMEHRYEEVVRTAGTSICITVDSASSISAGPEPGFLQKLVFDYSLFNPGAAFSLHDNDESHSYPAIDAAWRKWLPSDQTPAHWYNIERFEDLVGSYVAAERAGAIPRTVRDFVSEFRGLSSPVKQKQVVAQAGLGRAYLHDLIASQGRLDRPVLQRLLTVMQEASNPVKPDSLGVLGESHFRQRFQTAGNEGKSFRYKRLSGINSQGLPYVTECACVKTEDPLLRGIHIGLNWAVPLTNPIQENSFDLGAGGRVRGLSALLAASRIDMERDPVAVAVHLICPRFNFLDRGKGSINL